MKRKATNKAIEHFESKRRAAIENYKKAMLEWTKKELQEICEQSNITISNFGKKKAVIVGEMAEQAFYLPEPVTFNSVRKEFIKYLRQEVSLLKHRLASCCIDVVEWCQDNSPVPLNDLAESIKVVERIRFLEQLINVMPSVISLRGLKSKVKEEYHALEKRGIVYATDLLNAEESPNLRAVMRVEAIASIVNFDLYQGEGGGPWRHLNFLDEKCKCFLERRTHVGGLVSSYDYTVE